MPTIDEKGRELVARGWRQTSRKFRMLAKIPDGMTGMQALREADPRAADELEDRMNRQAADTFRRSHICKTLFPECFQEVDQPTFDAFRRAGGEGGHY